MSKKQLRVEGITNELAGASSFFATVSPAPLAVDISNNPAKNQNNALTSEAISALSSHQNEKSQKAPEPAERKATSKPASPKASVLASKQTPGENREFGDEVVEAIRKTVKSVGKEPLFVRMTPEEKRQISAAVYAFNEMNRNEDWKTTDNEISRIAINYIMAEYRQNGHNSVLVRVLVALHS